MADGIKSGGVSYRGLGLVMVLLIAMPAAGKTKLTYWNAWSGLWQEMQESIVAEFNASQEAIEVEYVHVPGNVYIDKLILAAAVGNVPDVMAIWGFTALQLAPLGILIPLDDFLNTLREEEFVPAAWKQFRWQGETCAMAYGAGANALIYNREVFEEAGLGEPPATLEEGEGVRAGASEGGGGPPKEA